MLTRVKIEGFKAIKDSGSVSLGMLMLFIGRNGSGKSSFIEALQWFQESIAGGLQAATEDRFDSFDELRNRRSREIGLHVTLDKGPREVRYDLWVKPDVAMLPIVASETCFEGRTSGTVKTISSRKGRRGPAVRSILGGNPVREGDSLALAQVARTRAPGAERLLRYVRDSVFLRLSPTAMARRGRLNPRVRGPILDEEGRNLVSLLANLTDKQGEWVAIQVARVISGVEAIAVVPEGDLGYFATRERMRARGGTRVFEIPAWLLSEGTRRLTAIFGLLAREPRPKLIAIEEVENGLDPWTLRIVFNELRKASEEGVQIILTTHSPFLLDHVAPEEIIHVTRENGETRYTPIEEYAEVANYKGVVPPGTMYLSDYLKGKKA